MADREGINSQILESHVSPVIYAQEVGEAHTPVPPSPFFLEVSHHFFSPVPFAPSSPPIFVQLVCKKPVNMLP